MSITKTTMLFSYGLRIGTMTNRICRTCKDYSNESTCTDKLHMSFITLNHFSWDESRSVLTLFPVHPDGNPGSFGYIGTPDTPIDCLFPTDGWSDKRGTVGCTRYDDPKEDEDWCSEAAAARTDYNDEWPGVDVALLVLHKNSTQTQMWDNLEWTGCAFRPEQKKDAIRIFGAAKNVPRVTEKYDFWYHTIFKLPREAPSYGAWSEAIVNGAVWNKRADKAVYAWYIDHVCAAMPECVQKVESTRKEYESSYGTSPPLVILRTNQKDAPFTVPSSEGKLR